MDFASYTYTEEQQRFRSEVREWIDENVPPDVPETEVSSLSLAMGSTARAIGDDYLDIAREIRRKLGQRGWLFSTYPSAYGGGGLSHEHEVILTEEISRRGVPIGYSNTWIVTALLVWGTDAQREKWLTPLLRGDLIAYQAFTEPQSGTDLANVQSTAVRSDNGWVLNGEKCFVSGPGHDGCDLLFGLFRTDSAAPRHRNLGYFIVPAHAEGVQMVPMRLLSGSAHSFVYYTDVEVSDECLVAGDHDGWRVAQTSLEEEHGGRGMPMPADSEADELRSYFRDLPAGRSSAEGESALQERVVDMYIDSRVDALLAVRNFSMAAKGMEMRHEGSQHAIWSRESSMRNTNRARDILGPYSQLERNDVLWPLPGSRLAYDKRLPPHAGGTLEIQKTIVARRLGIGRSQERAAITPSFGSDAAS